MPEKIHAEQEEMLSVWTSSDDPVLLVGEHDFMLTNKKVVLQTYLSEVSNRVSRKLELNPIECLKTERNQLLEQNQKLKQDFNNLNKRIETIESHLLEIQDQEKIVVLREISREEAKEEIKQLFDTGKVLYYSDIAKDLRIDLEVVVEICKELMEEGEITFDANLA